MCLVSPETSPSVRYRRPTTGLCFGSLTGGPADLWVPDVSESSLGFLLILLQISILTLKNHKLSCRGPFLVNQILLCFLGSVVFYKTMRCTVSIIFMGE